MNNTVAYLRSPSTIRAHCHQLLALAREDSLHHFQLNEDRLDHAVMYVLNEINTNYPDHTIPYHSRFRHFEAGGVNRIDKLIQLSSTIGKELVMMLTELAIVSVLLDAGAGKSWEYVEKESKELYTRSEGLAVASMDMFIGGVFSSTLSSPFQVDAEALIALSQDQLAQSLQVTPYNPLIGVKGRTALLNRLGKEIKNQPRFFGDGDNPRLGELAIYLLNHSKDATLSAPTILRAVLEAFSTIWPNGCEIAGVNVGDVGAHPLAKGSFGIDGLIPFHKLSQWLSYSLFEPLESIGITITEANELTGLPEYRNGGLLLDTGVLQLKDNEAFSKIHPTTSELVVEWRALTLALLDIIGDRVRKALGKTEGEFPLVKVLQGGTWSAGRKIANEKRENGLPPLHIESDGTIF